MHYTTVYDIANDGVGLQFPLIGLALILAGGVLKWGFGKQGMLLIVVGIFTLVAAGAVPWWDLDRVRQAVARGEAMQVEGPIRDWRVVRGRGIRTGSSSSYTYSHYELFSVGDVDFDITWNSLEAGFKNHGSTEKKRTVQLLNGIPARIWYLPSDSPGKPPRIVRIDLSVAGLATASPHGGPGEPLRIVRIDEDTAGLDGFLAPGADPAFDSGASRITDDARVLSEEQKRQVGWRLAQFEQFTGHRMVVVIAPTLGGEDIARHAADLAGKLGVGHEGRDDGVLLLIAPNERQARIAVGHDLQARLPDAACGEIMEMAILPMLRRGDIAAAIDAGASMTTAKLMNEGRR